MILYKYYPNSEYSYKAIANKGFWCQNAMNTNDPFEGINHSVFPNYSSVEIKSWKSQLKDMESPLLGDANDDLSLIAYLNRLRQELIKLYAFCSFSKKYNNVQMWSHYANNHSGFVVGFDIPEDKVTKVNYIKKLPQINFISYLNIIKNKNNLEALNIIKSDLSIKTNGWKYEKEWRIWVEKEGYFFYNRDMIKKIIFGLNCDNHTISSIINITSTISPTISYKRIGFYNDPIRLKLIGLDQNPMMTNTQIFID